MAAALTMIRLPARVRWLQTVGNALIAMLGITILVALWVEPDVEWYARLLGIECVLVAAITLLIPALARFSSSRRRETSSQGGPHETVAVRFCPSCGRPVAETPLGSGRPSVCTTCLLTFEVTASPQTGPDSTVGNSSAAERSDP